MKYALLVFAAALNASAAFAAQSGAPSPAPAAQPDTAKPAPGTQAIGRLFFTPAERAQLDVARVQKKSAQVASAEPAPAAPPPPQTVTYGGIVRRSDGKAMLWINNRLVEEKDALSALSLKGKVRPDGGVTLQVPDTGATIDMKVGQSVEVQSGRVAETRRPDPDAKPPAADAKPPGGDTKPAAADVKSPPQGAGQPPPHPAEKKAEGAGSSGLKTDSAGRRVDQSENQRITRESNVK